MDHPTLAPRRNGGLLAVALLGAAGLAGCKNPDPSASAAPGTEPTVTVDAHAPKVAPKTAAPVAATPASTAFHELARQILDETCRLQPTFATYLGIHEYDDLLEDYSREGAVAEVASLQHFRFALSSIDPAGLALADQLDREQLIHAVDSRLLTLTVIRPWANNPDVCGSGVTNTAYIMIKREFASPKARLEHLIARERKMPAAFAAARKNLANPPRILTEIALEQLDGNRDFFATAVPTAFKDVDDPTLLAAFGEANAAVLVAFDEWKSWLRDDLLPRSTGEFALGEETYKKKLWNDEMVDLPLGQLLTLAEADLRRNQAAFAETAALVDSTRPPAEVLLSLQADHPPAGELLAKTQGELDSIAAFLTQGHVVTIPDAAPARVQETPPFMRAMTFASMDTPGPFERVATEAYYSMTLPDPNGSAAETAEFMKMWYYAAITNVSVHEVWPGHYLQFLNAPGFPSDVRRVFGANTNIEGWAHYCEQMVIDQGFHADQPKYRLAQLQDALLRDVRFIVGIRMHTRGMTFAEAKELFMVEAYQPEPSALGETKRGTADPTYGYYTLGKLMILKLREDLQAKRGTAFNLQEFHDEFLRLGPLPLPLIRRALLGEAGHAL